MKTTARIFLFTILGFLMFVLSYVYGSFTGPVAAWIVLWLLFFFALLFWTNALHERGAIFAISSIVVSIVGQKLLEGLYGKQFIIEVLAQVFLVVGASLGINLVANWLIKVEQQVPPKG